MGAHHNHMQLPKALNTIWVKAALVVLMFLLALSPFEFGNILFHVLVEAYLSVAVFVILTLVIIYGLERIFNFDLGKYNRTHPASQVLISTFLGALPGCGGAIIVLTQYVNGHISFGSVVAVLIATMGDAAFLLIAKEPMTALFVIVVSVIAGIITGVVVDKVHGRDFLKVEVKARESYTPKVAKETPQFLRDITCFSAFIAFFPGAIIGLLLAFQFEIPHDVQDIVGGIGMFLLLMVWAQLKDINPMVNYAAEIGNQNMVRRIMDETAFIIVWVVMAFLLYDVAVYLFDVQLKSLFSGVIWMVPLMGVVIGFIPGCGPQIIVTTLYINGVIPLSAQLGNAISNDGDALFPAIAMAPKAAFLATLYSGVPALIISYAYFFMFE